jgi:hypothetical protein
MKQNYNMNHFKKLLFTLVAVAFLSVNLNAQYVISGQEPGSVKWKKINTDHYRIIYPDTMEIAIQRMANIMEAALSKVKESMPGKTKRIPIIIHPFTSTSNAFVGWAPKRMEFYTVPDMTGESQDWMTLLGLHENRHYLQYEKTRKSNSILLKAFFGQQATPLAIGLTTPIWYIEGDAVVRETALSNNGRGRNPAFTQLMKAQVVEKGMYSYSKATFGSYKDFTPNVYNLGYHIVGKGELVFDTIWNKSFSRTGIKDIFQKVGMYCNKEKRPSYFSLTDLIPFWPYTLNRSLQDHTNCSIEDMYFTTIEKQLLEWQKEIRSKKLSKFRRINPLKHLYSNYYFPFQLKDGKTIALKTGFDKRSTFVVIDLNGNERKLYEPGPIDLSNIDLKGNILTWTESRSHIRWGNISYSDIHTFNINTKKHNIITKKKRLFAPSLHPNTKKIAAIEILPDYSKRVVIVDSESGEIIYSHTSPHDITPVQPAWSDTEDVVFFIAIKNDERCIMAYDISKNETTQRSPWTKVIIKQMCITEPFIYFTGAFKDNTDNIFRYKQNTSVLEQLTSSKYGATYISICNDSITYSDYTGDGYDVVRAAMDSLLFEKTNFSDRVNFKLADQLSTIWNGSLKSSDIPDSTYQSSGYSKFANLINIHSWSLLPDISSGGLNPGFSILSQNELSTTVTEAGYRFNSDFNGGEWFAEVSYTGLFPRISLGATRNKMDLNYFDTIRRMPEFGENTTNSIYGTISVPLTLSKNNYSRYVLPSISLRYQETMITGIRNIEKRYINYMPVTMSLYAHNLKYQSARDLTYPFGQAISLSYISTPVLDTKIEDLFRVTGQFFFPGFFKNHSFYTVLAYQYYGDSRTLYSNRIPQPRNTDPVFAKKMYTTQFNYTFPLGYPDLSWESWIYLQRIGVNIFHDITYANNIIDTETASFSNLNQLNQASGINLFADLHLFRLISPIQLGIRAAYDYQINQVIFSPTINLDFYSIY